MGIQPSEINKMSFDEFYENVAGMRWLQQKEKEAYDEAAQGSK